MSRLDHEANEWLCKIVLFGPPTAGAAALAEQVVAALPAAEVESFWANPTAAEPTLVARYRPAASSLVDVKPVYSLHALRAAGSTATDRQHLLGNVDGVLLLLDQANLEASAFAERELERFLGMFGKMIATLPTVMLASAPLDESQQTALNPSQQSLFDAGDSASVARAVTTLTGLLEEDSGFGGLGLDLDAFADDDDDGASGDIDLDAFTDDDDEQL
ncbi:MAG TPA: hypothetical protein VGE07_06040 [Herpetosiphonaceae bacterium]